jgi:hypothetical protein
MPTLVRLDEVPLGMRILISIDIDSNSTVDFSTSEIIEDAIVIKTTYSTVIALNHNTRLIEQSKIISMNNILSWKMSSHSISNIEDFVGRPYWIPVNNRIVALLDEYPEQKCSICQISLAHNKGQMFCSFCKVLTDLESQ